MTVEITRFAYHNLPKKEIMPTALRALLRDVIKIADSSQPEWCTKEQLLKMSETGKDTFDIDKNPVEPR